MEFDIDLICRVQVEVIVPYSLVDLKTLKCALGTVSKSHVMCYHVEHLLVHHSTIHHHYLIPHYFAQYNHF